MPRLKEALADGGILPNYAKSFFNPIPEGVWTRPRNVKHVDNDIQFT